MTTVYLIRHAQAEGNVYRRAHGWYDGLITPMGYRQIEALKNRFQAIAVDACYSSDLFRTQTTAEAVYRPKNLPLQLHPGLREIHMGIWEDRTWGECRLENPDVHAAYLRCEGDWSVEGSESFSQLTQRVSSAVSEIAKQNPDRVVAIFCHGMAIRNYVAFVQGKHVNELPHGDNTSVSKLQVEDGTIKVEYYADASHLTQEISTFAKQSWWRNEKGIADDVNFCFRPLKPEDEMQFLRSAHEDAWQNIYGVSCPNVEAYAMDTVQDAEKSGDAVRTAQLDGETIGLVQLAPISGADDGVAHLSFLYLLPEYRQKGLGAQLLGESISLARRLGREKLRLYCSQQNTAALKFYEKHGFRKIGETTHADHVLDILILPIGTNQGAR